MSSSVNLSDEAYALLLALKGPNESFSDVVLREFGRGRPPLRLLDMAPRLDAQASLEETRRRRRAAEADRDRKLSESRSRRPVESMPMVADTTFLIDAARGDRGAVKKLRELAQAGETLMAPAIVAAEFLDHTVDPRGRSVSSRRRWCWSPSRSGMPSSRPRSHGSCASGVNIPGGWTS